MLDIDVLKSGLHYAKLFEASTGVPSLGPEKAQYHPDAGGYETSLQLEGITVDMRYQGDDDIFTDVGHGKPLEVTGRIIAPNASVFRGADVMFRGRLEAEEVARGASGWFQGVKAFEVGRDGEDIRVSDTIARQVGRRANSLRVKRTKADVIGTLADTVRASSVDAEMVDPIGSVHAVDSTIGILGCRSSEVYALNTECGFIGERAGSVAMFDSKAHSVGKYADGLVVVVNSRADYNGEEARGPVRVYDDVTIQKERMEEDWYGFDMKMRSPVEEYEIPQRKR